MGGDPGQVIELQPPKQHKPDAPVDTTEEVDEPELSPGHRRSGVGPDHPQDRGGVRRPRTCHPCDRFADGGRNALQAIAPRPGRRDRHSRRSGTAGVGRPSLVQVKSGGQVGAPVVSQVHGVMATYGAPHGLLVAWGGLSKPAQDASQDQPAACPPLAGLRCGRRRARTMTVWMKKSVAGSRSSEYGCWPTPRVVNPGWPSRCAF